MTMGTTIASTCGGFVVGQSVSGRKLGYEYEYEYTGRA